MRRNVRKVVDAFADWRDQNRPSIRALHVEVTERYLRRRLGLRTRDALVYRGLLISCKPSKETPCRAS